MITRKYEDNSRKETQLNLARKKASCRKKNSMLTFGVLIQRITQTERQNKIMATTKNSKQNEKKQ